MIYTHPVCLGLFMEKYFRQVSFVLLLTNATLPLLSPAFKQTVVSKILFPHTLGFCHVLMHIQTHILCRLLPECLNSNVYVSGEGCSVPNTGLPMGSLTTRVQRIWAAEQSRYQAAQGGMLEDLITCSSRSQ